VDGDLCSRTASPNSTSSLAPRASDLSSVSLSPASRTWYHTVPIDSATVHFLLRIPSLSQAVIDPSPPFFPHRGLALGPVPIHLVLIRYSLDAQYKY